MDFETFLRVMGQRKPIQEYPMSPRDPRQPIANVPPGSPMHGSGALSPFPLSAMSNPQTEQALTDMSQVTQIPPGTPSSEPIDQQLRGLFGGGGSPQNGMGFGQLASILMRQSQQQQDPHSDPRYQAGYAAADAYLRRMGRH